MSEYRVTIEVKTRLARFAARLVYSLRHVVGNARAQRWATAAANRFVRYRVLGGRWQRFNTRELRP